MLEKMFQEIQKILLSDWSTRRNTLDFLLYPLKLKKKTKKHRYTTTRQSLLSWNFFAFSVLPLGHRGMLIGIFIYFQCFHCFQRFMRKSAWNIKKKVYLKLGRFKVLLQEIEKTANSKNSEIQKKIVKKNWEQLENRG